MSYSIKTNPFSRYSKAIPRAQQKALQRNGTKYLTVEHKGSVYNGIVVGMDRRKGTVTLQTSKERLHVMRMLDITRIKAQGLIMEY
jgi:hypothetical protein